MAQSPLYEVLANSAAGMVAYGGVETAAQFSEIRNEFRALSSGCAIYDLTWRGKVEVSGRDRIRWLNGMVTNNIKDLPVNRGNYSFVLNPQGRILGDLYTYNRGECLLIDTDYSQLENLLKLLRRYIIMDKIELTDRSSELGAMGVQGPGAGDILRNVGIEDPGLEPMQLVSVTWNGIPITLTRMASADFVTYELWAPAQALSQLWTALHQAGAVPVGSVALEKFRVAIGFPKYGADIRDRDLPQETRQDHALNFTKGCYIGQEIVERIRARGNVHRLFQAFQLEGEVPPIGSKFQVDGKDAGEITSVARIPNENGEQIIALGYIRREALGGSAKITYPGGEAKLADTPVPLAS